MTAQIFKFPYNAQRRLHSRRPRRSKNGTPEERAAKAAANLPPAAAVVPLPVQVVEAPHEKEGIDRRKLRGSPLRDQCAAISFGATVVGKIHTAGLKGEPLEAIPAEIRKEWLATLDSAIDAGITVAIGLEQAKRTLEELRAGEKSEISHSPVNLPVIGEGQPVLNSAGLGQTVLPATEREQ